MEKKELELIKELEKLKSYLHGAYSVCDHENPSAAFHQAAHDVEEIIALYRASL